MELCKTYRDKLVEKVKDQLKEVNFKNYSIYQLEPKCKELNYGFSVLRKDYIEFINTTEEKCTTILKLKYEDIRRVYIDNILVTIEMYNGNLYYMKELRFDLEEILNDFNGEYIIISDDKRLYILKDYTIEENYENDSINIVGNLIDDDNIITHDFKYTVNCNNIKTINEDYMGKDDTYRDVEIKTTNDNIMIWQE